MRKSYYGEKSGRLTIIDTRELLVSEKALCRCFCGVEKYIQVGTVIYQKVQSCGCLQREIMSRQTLIDLTKKKFGELTVLSFSHVNSDNKAVWTCQCSCGAIFECSSKYLRSGKKTRCRECIYAETRAQKIKSEVGNVYGKLTVLSFSHINKHEATVWDCKCRCGNTLKCDGTRLRSGKKTQCNECASTERGIILSKNLVGKKFGMLTIVSLSKKKGKGGKRYLNCICDCGNKMTVSSDSLIRGNTSSCGCLVSKAESDCKLVLFKYKIEFEPQKTFENCVYHYKLRFDFYMPDSNICIELDGEQHFKPVKYFGGEETFKKIQECDAIKNKYCSDNNIKLLRIPYTQFDNIEQVLIDNKIIKK